MDNNNQVTQWEYKKETDYNEENLNKLGEQGWEVAGTFSNGMGPNQVLLKRPKKIKSVDPEFSYSR